MTIAEAAKVANVWFTDGETEPTHFSVVRILITWPGRQELFEVDATWQPAPPEANRHEGYFSCMIWGDQHECGLKGTPWRYREAVS